MSPLRNLLGVVTTAGLSLLLGGGVVVGCADEEVHLGYVGR